ncbi:putative cytoplasmic protein [Desulfofarcimen acetoxidans DSM 771]|jgi:HPt (histidine-containing phosphotransfer) domain-containing protein|uniref:Putative cytoplasmic protein n=1 Tax=Desulfofarcimen acetoxidans (strain ATCC 49208 / DSM 771 / KCTC 5769 / VKM B-1644 / 5575) TaxID=485916 RepID=C8VX93_DESAS|nr:Hpt domain-containing protein [Desulfofarcimen acetoxidans]ACV64489.1 putative cytoplasmic protein [Desulfofarcimen acetoxidans DSM 771]
MEIHKILSQEKIIIKVDSCLEDLIPEYLSNRQKDIKNLLEALEQVDYDSIIFIGHNMKGSGGAYGFDYITEIGCCLEVAAKERNCELIDKKVQELTNYLERIQIDFVL